MFKRCSGDVQICSRYVQTCSRYTEKRSEICSKMLISNNNEYNGDSRANMCDKVKFVYYDTSVIELVRF